jgi:hypothetical protein
MTTSLFGILLAVSASLVLALPGVSQEHDFSVATKACGPNITHFKLQTTRPGKSDNDVEDVPSGRSRIVVFSENIGPPVACNHSVIRIGMDGEWVGATCPGSYLRVDIPPGDHHLCADLQGEGRPAFVALHHLNVHAGETSFFRAQLIASNLYGANSALHLDSIDEDEGRFLLATRMRSTSGSSPSK